ncbi:MAG: OmpA family protein [Muribaculaceae bacterium]|nr:OmpA family protein [Muribaculaceae bacterium]MDE6753444.1 OmpA family protein [Muribaculaceae bacterium]
MKLNKILLTASLLLGGLCANAQETVTEYVFQPHWYGQAQIGLQETLGEGAFGKLLAPNAQLAAGYKFNPYIGARLAVNAWQSKGTLNFMGNHKWKWNYVAPTVDAVVDLTNLIGGYNPNRLVEVNLLAGVGINIGFHNKEANAINNELTAAIKAQPNLPDPVPGGYYNSIPANYNVLGNIWDGTKTRFVGQVGVDVNFNVTEQLQVGLELMANSLSDNYNSKVGSNADWYFNALVGVKYAFGPKYETRTRTIEVPAPEPVIVEKVVEKIVEVPVQVEKPVVKEEVSMRRDIFFTISNSTIAKSEQAKVQQIADFLKENPEAKVVITGYADKGTGTMAINLRLSKQRAQTVANELQKKYGIPASRMEVKSMGESEYQPYPDPVQNRVAICIAK